MRARFVRTASAGCVAAGLWAVALSGQTALMSPEAHRAAAKAAAGADHPGLLAALCPDPASRGAAPARAAAPPAAPSDAAGQRGQATPQAPSPAPSRNEWHAEPVRVFDNLYWFGQTEYSAWVVTT